jgi:hypothetical protein
MVKEIAEFREMGREKWENIYGSRLLDRQRVRCSFNILNWFYPKTIIAGKRLLYCREEILDQLIPHGLITQSEFLKWLEEHWDKTNKLPF